MPKRAIALTTALFTASAFAPPKAKPKPQPQRHTAPEMDETLADLVLSPRPPPPVPPVSPPVVAVAVVSTSAPVTTASSRPTAPKRATAGNRTPARAARAAGAQGALARIRQCESGSNYGARSASGRYGGAYQMDRRTFASVGGSGDPATASKAEQDYRARILYQRRGGQPWANCA